MAIRKFGVEHQKVELDPADEQGLSKTALHRIADLEEDPDSDEVQGNWTPPEGL
jgi:hypothetical protein